MSNTNLEDVILQAVDIIATKKIASAGYDKTIQATIVSCVDATIGKYKVKYQDGYWYAYSSNIDTSYSDGSNVFILVPGGDMTRDKTILGTTKKLGINYVTVAEGDQMYAPVGTNVITNTGTFELCSYETSTMVLYSKDFSQEQNLIQLDTQAVEEYLRGSTYIVAGGYIRTELNVQQQYQGNYGILLGLDFIDNATQEQVTRYYSIDVDKMMGNPYRLPNETRQYGVFQIDGGNFVRVNMISLFTKDFPIQAEEMPKDIFISNIELGGAIALSQDDLNSCALVLITPKGYIFNKNSTDEDTRTIQAQLRVKGKTVDSKSQNVPFYWFVENMTTFPRSREYNKYGGQGWECLNKYNVVKPAQIDEEGVEVSPEVVQFIPGKDTFTVKKSQALAKKTKYKCVAVYDGTVLSKEITIINYDSDYDIFIESDKGTQFYYDIGNPTLTCRCRKRKPEEEKEDETSEQQEQQTEEQDDGYEDVDLDLLKFVWGVTNNVGYFESLPDSEQVNEDLDLLIFIRDIIQEYLDNEWLLYQQIFNVDNLYPTDQQIEDIRERDSEKKKQRQELIKSIKQKLIDKKVTKKIINDIFEKYFIEVDENTTYSMLLTPVAEEKVTLGTIISTYDSTQRIEKNKIIDLDVKNITRFATYKCSIFTKQGNHFLGTASITITNVLQGEDLYSLVINHGSQVFKYNTHGVSPASQQNKIPLQLPALTFTVYDNLGNAIEDDVIKHSEITWIVPSQNTMLQISDSYQGAPDSTLTKMVYKNLMSFSYGISERFNVNRSQNNIELKVNYNGLNLVASTDFTFIKQGASGTNGTDFVCKVVPNVTYGKKPLYPTLYYDGVHVTLNWNTAGNNWFKAELWHNGNEPIFSGYASGNSTEGKLVTVVGWEILSNKYDKKNNTVITEQSNFSISGNSFYFQGANISQPANIIKVTLNYDGYTYYGTLPVITVRLNNPSYKIDLKENTGFREVLYSSSGMRPEYDSHAPFELIVQKKLGENRSEDMSLKTSYEYGLTYNWSYLGSVYHRTRKEETEETKYGEEITTYENEWDEGTSDMGPYLMNSNLFDEQPLKNNQKAVKPVDEYDGECINIALGCFVSSQSGGSIGYIHIPIHFLRNRFFNSAINGWDGNSVELGGQNGGTILAPQVGAGIKTENNEFTGILIGTVKDPKEDLSEDLDNTDNGNKRDFASDNQDVGLFGYHEGSRSIFLDAKTGKAVFGEQKQAQIVLDPTQTKEIEIDDGNGQSHKEKKKVAMIRSGGYWYKPYNKLKDQDGEKAEQGTASEARDPRGRGMMIDLTTPEIKFGSGNFQVDSKGHVIARGGGQIAGWKITDYAMYNRRIRKHSNDTDDELNVSQNYTGINSNPNVDKDGRSNDSKKGNGSEYRQVKMPPGTTDSDKESGQAESTRYTIVGKAAAFWAGKDKFFVTHDGYLRAQNASIGSGAYPIFIGRSTNKDAKSNSAIFSGEKSEKNAEKTGFYLGTDGLGIGTTYNIEALKADAPTNNELYIDEDPKKGIKEEWKDDRRVSNFQVDTNGMFYARRGYIGNGRRGWEVGNTYLKNGKQNLNDVENNGVYIGTNGISLGVNDSKNIETGEEKKQIAFKVTSSGDLTANTGHIANWKISKNSIRTEGTGDSYSREPNTGEEPNTTDGKVVIKNGMYFGVGGLRLGANFHVDDKGNLYANNGVFNGKITARRGKIGNWWISNTGIQNSDPEDKAKTPTVSITPSKLVLGTFYATKEGEIGRTKQDNETGLAWKIEANGKAHFYEAADVQINGGRLTGSTMTGNAKINGSTAFQSGTISTNAVRSSGGLFTGNTLDEWAKKLCVNTLETKYLFTAQGGKAYFGGVVQLKANAQLSLNSGSSIMTHRGAALTGQVTFQGGGWMYFTKGLLTSGQTADGVTFSARA